MQIVKTVSMLMVATLALFVGGTGCGSSKDSKFDQKYITDSTKTATDAREIFDKVQGDYSKLSEEDHKRFIALYGNNEEQAKKVWNLMANPRSGAY